MPTSKKASKRKSQQSQQSKHKKKNDAAKVSVDSFLFKFLGILISVSVVLAAFLVKPLLESSNADNGLFSFWSTLSSSPSTTTTTTDRFYETESVIADVENATLWPPPDNRVNFLVSRACLGMPSDRQSGDNNDDDDDDDISKDGKSGNVKSRNKYGNIFCHKDLRVSERHFRATERIEPGEVLFEIPRSLQLWDLDALRDPWIRLHIFEATHRLSGNKVGSEAYLAVYLALQFKRSQEDSRQWQMEILDLAYFDLFSNYEELKEFHPLMATDSYMRGLLGFSEATGVLKAYRNMILSEYEAFQDFSKQFAETISRNEYYVARLNVLMRAIRVGPPGPEQAVEQKFLRENFSAESLLADELEAYKEMLDIDLEKDGCVALVPIADLLNHHPQNNVEYAYSKTELNERGALVVRVDHRRVEKGFEPLVSYGNNIPDIHLFARYGFVNGDGSGPAQVSIAFHHDILKLNISAQFDYFPSSGLTSSMTQLIKRPILDYLRFDDGYFECIPGRSTHPEEAELKSLKHQHLMQIANIPERWQIVVPARNPYAFPAATHKELVMLQPPQPIKFFMEDNVDLKLALSTCRLLSLIPSDYNGRAPEILKKNLENAHFILPEDNDALEYRSWMCVHRWIGAGYMNLEQTFGTTKSEFQRLRYVNHREGAIGTREWAAVSVRLGEMQALKGIAVLVQRIVEERWGSDPPSLEEYTVREDPCPEEYQRFLYDNEFGYFS